MREGDRIISVQALAVVGVNADGCREIPWPGRRDHRGRCGPARLPARPPVARALSGVQPVVSDAHAGPVDGMRRPARRVLAGVNRQPTR
ncbi:hypothetical protein ACH4ZX_33675 [Streptomyces sp. NPDC020490]|uniref:hypothetical protein n=1 Tax=Streptomyces sp. NPDC020490 TaxID=3365078 RepID=UPI0037BB7AF4